MIYESTRTKERQEELVDNGKSQTRKSYHIVGQAFDFVPIVNGKEGWNSYDLELYIKYAKSLGFTWGGDWKGFVDEPHLQFEYKGYGTDKTLENKPKPPVYPGKIIKKGSKGKNVQLVQKELGINADSIFGPITDQAVRNFQKKNGLSVDGKVGPITSSKLFN
ncbi:M15 family metallopeptidase [Gottfriedia sp. NPDC056225]|uniref:M15 family metallopeptidase n=1 Tax=Gottfriedia sp. NPDC056225 TaxID=3345751 RepID=UPI0035D74225